MWYLRYVNIETGETITEAFNTLAQARDRYINSLSNMAYGAIYQANNEEEQNLADDLFRASEEEITRREEEVTGYFNFGYDW